MQQLEQSNKTINRPNVMSPKMKNRKSGLQLNVSTSTLNQKGVNLLSPKGSVTSGYNDIAGDNSLSHFAHNN